MSLYSWRFNRVSTVAGKHQSEKDFLVMHVVMLVNNPCANDSRVIRSAEALADAGWKITVVCRHFQGLPEREDRKGVHYFRVQPALIDWNRLKMRPFPESVVSRHPNAGPIPREGLSGCSGQLSSLKSLAKRAGKYVLKATYWFFASDEFSWAARRHIAKLRPNIVHAHDLTTLPAGGRAAAQAGAWLIYDAHELELHRATQLPWFARLRRRMLERKYIRGADAVVTVSESIADHLHANYRIPRPRVVMNAPALDLNVTPSTTVREDLGLRRDVPLCVYVGKVTANRGLEQAVRALALLPGYHLATVGPRRPATEALLLELAAEVQVNNRLHIMSSVAADEVVGYIATADVSLLPIQNICLSYYYCMPNKLLESVFAGVPVAVANLLELRRFVEANQCGLVMDETRPDAIAEAIKRIVENRERYLLSPSRYVMQTDIYSWQSQATRLQSLYSEFQA